MIKTLGEAEIYCIIAEGSDGTPAEMMKMLRVVGIYGLIAKGANGISSEIIKTQGEAEIDVLIAEGANPSRDDQDCRRGRNRSSHHGRSL